jgi:hypothetical protein
MDRWRPPHWISRAIWGFGAFALIGVIVGQVSDRAPLGWVQSVLGVAGMIGLFFIGLLFIQWAKLGVEVSAQGQARPMSPTGRGLTAFVAIVFLCLCVGSVLFVAGLID